MEQERAGVQCSHGSSDGRVGVIRYLHAHRSTLHDLRAPCVSTPGSRSTHPDTPRRGRPPPARRSAAPRSASVSLGDQLPLQMDQNNAPQRNVHNAYAMQRGAWAPPFNSRLGLNSMYSTVVVIVCGVQKQLTKRGAVHACGAAGCGELADRDDAVAAQEQLRGAPLLPLPAVVGR